MGDKYMFGKTEKHKRSSNQNIEHDSDYKYKNEPIPKSIDKVKMMLNEIFSQCSDFLLRDIICSKDGSVRMIVAFINGFIDKRVLNQDVIRPILEYLSMPKTGSKENQVFEKIKECIICNNDIKEVKNIKQVVDNIVSGEALLFIDGEDRALVIGVKTPQGRQVTEPDTEVSIRGAREGFVENLLTNTTLLRKRIKNPNLKLEMIQLGKQTRTDVCICYIKGLANDAIVEEVKKRLMRINIDGILDTGIIEQYISDSRLSLFPTVGNSEKCDKLAGKLLEGRVAIFCDGTPYVITVPYLFIEAIQATDDYFDHVFLRHSCVFCEYWH